MNTKGLKADRLDLIVELDPEAGFCTGVKKAIKKAEEMLEDKGELYCIGQIVHNDEEIKRLEDLGLKTIDYPDLKDIKNKTILFRAHGEPPESYHNVAKSENKLVDATCPVVLKIQDRIKDSSGEKETVLIYGKKEHPEVIGLKGQGGNNVIVFNDHDLTKTFISKLPKKIALFSQTTMDPERYSEVTNVLTNSGIDVSLNKTICGQVSGRKKKLEIFCKKFDKIVFVAGKKSSNGKVLFSYCQAIIPNAYYISSPDELNQSWFNKNDRIGVTGGTSTPSWLMEKTCFTLESF